MNRINKLYSHCAIFLLLLFGSFSAQAVTLPGPLVSTEWLLKYADTVTVLDIRVDADSFKIQGHIPSASLVMLNQIRTQRVEKDQTISGMVVTRDVFQALMRNNGVNNKQAVIITYPQQSVVLATRLYWTLKYYGHQQVALLDGGNGKWKSEHHPIIHTVTTPNTGQFEAVIHPEMLATKADVIQAINDQNNQILDARSLPFFMGKTKKQSVQKAGHIPNAKLLPQAMMIDNNGNTSFSSSETLGEVLKSLNIKQSVPSITYCNSGLSASGPWFVMHELLGNKNTRLYDGSMLEWAADNQVKVETGNGP